MHRESGLGHVIFRSTTARMRARGGKPLASSCVVCLGPMFSPSTMPWIIYQRRARHKLRWWWVVVRANVSHTGPICIIDIGFENPIVDSDSQILTFPFPKGQTNETVSFSPAEVYPRAATCRSAFVGASGLRFPHRFLAYVTNIIRPHIYRCTH